jgi:hypothetical protein
MGEAWTWQCIVCGKGMGDPDIAGDDGKAQWPTVEGGTMSIDFGYGSRFDDMNLDGRCVEHQACICDDCFEAKRHLTRAVVTRRSAAWEILPADYRDSRVRPA